MNPARPDHRARRMQTSILAATIIAITTLAVLTVRYGIIHGAPDPDHAGLALVPIVVAALIGLTGTFALRVRAYTGESHNLRRLSIAYSLLTAVTIGVTWSLIVAAEPEKLGFGTAISDDTSAKTFLNEAPTTPASAGEELVVPTGVFIQSVEFVDAIDVIVTGYIWQKYSGTIPPDFERGIVLPEAIEEAYEATEAYREQGPDYELIGWYFKATLRQHFEYRHYPFDRQDVWLRIWPKEQARPVILVPDFAAYDTWDPRATLGVDEQFVLDGWRLDYSTFGYSLNRYTTTFGLGDRSLANTTPELYFSLGLRRQVVDVLVSRLIRILAVTFLLFGLVLASHIQPAQKLLIDVLPLAGALCFILILDHNELRDLLRPAAIIYLEYAYFILYAVLILAVLNALLLTSNRIHIPIVEHDEGVLLSLIFWPLVLTLFLIATLIAFYGP